MRSKYIKENANDVVHHLEYNAERTHDYSRITVGIYKNSQATTGGISLKMM
jgi:hypothetical protein